MVLRALTVVTSAVALTGFGQAVDSVQQLVAMQSAWGPKANSTGAVLTLVEGSRTTARGHTVVRYRMETSGLTKDKAYSLLMWQTGGQLQAVMSGITIDASGTAICAGKAGSCGGGTSPTIL